jgi:hypothetical protein
MRRLIGQDYGKTPTRCHRGSGVTNIVKPAGQPQLGLAAISFSGDNGSVVNTTATTSKEFLGLHGFVWVN